MNCIASFLAVCFWISIAGCCSSESVKKSAETLPDTASSSVPSAPAQRQAIVQNVSRVEAVIEALTMVDNTQFSLTIFVITSEPVSGRFSLIEPEQRVTIYPQFIYTDGKTMDANNPQNQKILSLRNATVGQSFKGKISIDQRGLWRLLEVEDR